jgi:hypothetical protein
MADTDKKPRDIKDLKARLGRTVTPGQLGKPVSVPPGAGNLSPPALGSRPPAAMGSKPPVATLSRPPSAAAGLPVPSSGISSPLGQAIPGKMSLPAPGGIAAPPFMQPQKQEPKAAARTADPFSQAAAASAVEKKVTLVIDDSAVNASEIGRKSTMKVVAVLGVGVLLGLIIGFMVGNTAGDRKMWSLVISDTKGLYNTINDISKTLEEAKTNVQTIYTTSQGGPGRQAKVDYDTIQKLVAIKKPISANAFHRKRYMAFQAGTVDDLFDYYNNINIMWDKFTYLAAITAGKKRELLDKSAVAADALLNNEYGLIPFIQGEAIAGGIVLVELPAADEAQKEPVKEKKKGKGKEADEEEANLKVMVASKAGGNLIEKTRFVGQKEILENPSDFVIMINKSRSMGILGQAASQFAEFRGEVTKLNLMMNQTMEIQGRLIKMMGEVAARY